MSEKNQQLKVKVAPHSKESEMMTLGCMITSVNALNTCADQLQPQDFYFLEHQLIFECLKNAYLADKPADIHLIAEDLRSQQKLEKVGGVAYLTTLAQYAGTSAYIEEYIEIVRNKSILRKMITAADKIEKNALEEPQDVQSALDEAQSILFNISQQANTRTGMHIKDFLSGALAPSKIPYLRELQEKQEQFHEKGPETAAVTGIPTHFIDLDKMMGGLNKSNLIILAARPSMGKTAFALNIVENVALKANTPVGVFSLEMTSEELVHRLVCSTSEVESEKIKAGSLNGIEYQRVVESVNRLQKHTIVIDDQPGLKITDLRARARRMKEVYDIGFLIVDYLQLLSGSKNFYNSDNRQNEISEISRMLKNLARELSIPILCLSQLSRKVEERAGHRPMLSDLRESGSIEQDADIVMFIFRREYYNANDKPGLAEIIIAKNRHGSVGDVQLAFRKSIAQFNNYIPQNRTMQEDNSSAFAAFSP
ncbi:MAG: replicative DNA helicase [Chlamydiae bacterium]|nr:replicative DNA helicase [Chlamydiota bacterium]